MPRPTVNLCTIATDKYRKFVVPLLMSARKYFCADFGPCFHIWLDAPVDVSYRYELADHPQNPDPSVSVHPVQHEAWPGVTLHKFRTILTAKEELLARDFTFLVDVDGLFVRHVGEEILGELVAVIHAGYDRKPIHLAPFENRRESTAYTSIDQRRLRFAGGFMGGRTTRFLRACEEMDNRIKMDEKRGVLAQSHDESHWNCYLANLPEARQDCRDGGPIPLPADYCAHEGAIYSNQQTARFISLAKNNAEYHV